MILKRNGLWVWMAVPALAAGLVAFAPAIGAQAQSPDRSAQQQPDQSQKQQPQQQQKEAQEKAYVGQVIQAQNGQFALLTDKTAGRGYFLDDQAKAKKYNGQTVKVTGTVDTETKTLHIAEIQPMPH